MLEIKGDCTHCFAPYTEEDYSDRYECYMCHECGTTNMPKIEEDDMKYIFENQAKMQEALGVFPINGVEGEEHKKAVTQYIKNHALYLVAETDEMLRELKYLKEWKRYDNFDEEVHAANAKEEWIDMLIFLVNIGIALGIDAKDVASIYRAKLNINYERQDNDYGKNEK